MISKKRCAKNLFAGLIAFSISFSAFMASASAECTSEQQAALTTKLIGTWIAYVKDIKKCFTYGFEAGGKFKQVASDCGSSGRDGVSPGTWSLDQSCQVEIIRDGGASDPKFTPEFQDDDTFIVTIKTVKMDDGSTLIVKFVRK